MAKNVTIQQLFEKLGRMYMQLIAQDEDLLALRQQNSETSQVAGEALRALESIGRKDIAQRIMHGDKWDAPQQPQSFEMASASDSEVTRSEPPKT